MTVASHVTRVEVSEDGTFAIAECSCKQWLRRVEIGQSWNGRELSDAAGLYEAARVAAAWHRINEAAR